MECLVDLTLPSELVLLKDCYYVLTMCRNIISVSCLDKDGFDFTIRDSVINIHLDGIYYGNGLLSNDQYVLNVDNDKSIYNIKYKED